MHSRLKKIKLIVFDLDGTLLSNEGEIGERTKYYVSELKKTGVQFSFASGRLHSAIVNYAKELDIQAPVISLDGCYIKNLAGDKVIFEMFVKPKHVKRAIKFADHYLLNIALCHSDAIYITDQNTVLPQIMDKFGAEYREIDSYDNHLSKTLEIVFAGSNKEWIKYVYNKMSFPYCAGLALNYYQSHSHEGIYYLEVRRKGSSKAKGFARLCKGLKVKQTESAVLGDWYNDISLFKTKAVKVAVANAVPELKRMADIVTKRTNDEDGAAEFLEMVYKAKTGK